LKTTAQIRVARRRAGGNALLEFLLTIPIIVFVAGLTVYMSMAMLAKQQALVEARANMYKWSHGGWSAMKLEGWDPSLSTPGVDGPNWDNLPGRFKTNTTKTFKTAPMWSFIETSAAADHVRDSSAWHYDHLDIWKIARSGPLSEVFNAFRQNLQINDVAPHVIPTRNDIYTRWWHADNMLGQVGRNLQTGG
jgi:hypothetical protein